MREGPISGERPRSRGLFLELHSPALTPPCLIETALYVYSDVIRNLKDLVLLGTFGFHIPQKATGQKNMGEGPGRFAGDSLVIPQTGCYALWERAQKPGLRVVSTSMCDHRQIPPHLGLPILS